MASLAAGGRAPRLGAAISHATRAPSDPTEDLVSKTPDAERPRGARFFDRFTDPITDIARDKMNQVEDKVRTSIQAEVDAVGRSVKDRAVQIRPSALAFGAAALLTLFGFALLLTAAVVGLAGVIGLWLSALLIGLVILLVAAGFAALGHHRLPAPVNGTPPAPHPAPDADELVHPWAD
jgi:hypothetical protein